MAEKPEKCPKCGMAFYRTVQDAGSFLGGDDTLVSYSVDIDEFDCSSRGTRDGGFFNQSGICLMRERDALRARVAELEAEVERMRDAERVAWARCHFYNAGHVRPAAILWGAEGGDIDGPWVFYPRGENRKTFVPIELGYGPVPVLTDKVREMIDQERAHAD